MRRTKIIEIIILGLWLTLAVTYVLKTRFHDRDLPLPNSNFAEETNSIKAGKEFSVRRIAVLDGNTFDMLMKDNDSPRLLCELDVKATTDAKSKVIDLLNSSQQPKVKLINRQDNGKWLVNLMITENNKEINLSSWLKENKLVYR